MHGQGSAKLFDGSVYTGALSVTASSVQITLLALLYFVSPILRSLSIWYTGNWKRDRWEGWGRVVYGDGSIFEGHFADGLRSGQVSC